MKKGRLEETSGKGERMIKDAIEDAESLERTESSIDLYLDGWRCLEERKGGVMCECNYCYHCGKKIGLLAAFYPVRKELSARNMLRRLKTVGVSCAECVEVEDKPTTIFKNASERGSDETL